jgi:hypothetical protein
MAAQFLDARGEYSRQCPYCLEYITVDHMSRKYCPEKNGIKDFCKSRFKRLKDNLKSNGVVLDQPESQPLKIRISRDPSARRKTIDDSIYDSMIRRNIKILRRLIGENEYLVIGLNELKKQGYEMDFFTSQHENAAGIVLHKIGPFAVGLKDDENVYITYFNLLKI